MTIEFWKGIKKRTAFTNCVTPPTNQDRLVVIISTGGTIVVFPLVDYILVRALLPLLTVYFSFLIDFAGTLAIIGISNGMR